MARAVTRLQLQNRALQLSNMEGRTNLWPLADVQERINTHLTEQYDWLRNASPPDYYSSITTITTSAGIISYGLPADFLDLQEVLVQEGATDRLRELRPMRRGMRSRYQSPQGAYTVKLGYTPTPTALASDSDTFDGVNGWDELIVCLVARDLLIKQRGDTSQMDMRIAECRARIKAMGNRDRSSPRYLRDVDEESVSSLNGLGCYRLIAGNLELYEVSMVWP